MNIFITLLFLMILSSCTKDGIQTSDTDNSNFDVTLLFTYHGINVYRFGDGGRCHYFTSRGECISTQRNVVPIGKTYHVRYEDEVIYDN